MTVGGYSVRSMGNYVGEMRFLFEYYPEVEPAALSAEQVEEYICGIGGPSQLRGAGLSRRLDRLAARWKEALKAKHKFLFPVNIARCTNHTTIPSMQARYFALNSCTG